MELDKKISNFKDPIKVDQALARPIPYCDVQCYFYFVMFLLILLCIIQYLSATQHATTERQTVPGDAFYLPYNIIFRQTQLRNVVIRFLEHCWYCTEGRNLGHQRNNVIVNVRLKIDFFCFFFFWGGEIYAV